MSYEQGSVVTISVLWEDNVTDLRLTIRRPDNTLDVLGFADVDHDSGAAHHYDLVADQVGDYYYLWEALSPGLGPKEGDFQVDVNTTTVEGVTDQRDVRVMIPRVRRAIDGPSATSPLSPSTTLNDGEVEALIADAVANIILNTGSAFGHTLEVSARDPFYLAPTAWIVDPEFTEAEGSVVVAEAALTFYFHKFQELKVQEEISDEGQTWSWQISASLVRDQMKMLQDARDRALEVVMQSSGLNLDSYVSYIEVRDRATSLYIEPWIADNGGIGGQEGALALGYDPRFE
jgi:hypothetical protein